MTGLYSAYLLGIPAGSFWRGSAGPSGTLIRLSYACPDLRISSRAAIRLHYLWRPSE